MPNLSTKLSVEEIIAAVKKLSVEEKHLLKLKLYGKDLISEMKAFEKEMSKTRKPIKKTDEEIVAAVRKIRQERFEEEQNK